MRKTSAECTKMESAKQTESVAFYKEWREFGSKENSMSKLLALYIEKLSKKIRLIYLENGNIEFLIQDEEDPNEFSELVFTDSSEEPL